MEAPRLLQVLMAIVVAGSAATAAELRVNVRAEDGVVGGPVGLRLVCGETDVTRQVELEGGKAVAVFATDAPPPCLVRAEAPGIWAPEVEYRPGSSPEVSLRLWPASYLTFRVRSAESGDPVEASAEIRVGLSVAEVSGDVTSDLTSRCTVTDQVVERCDVPAGRWHLRLDSSGFAPEYRWGVRAEAGQEVELSPVVLERAATIVGRVARPDGSPGFSGLEVEMRPLVDRSGLTEEERRKLSNLVSTAPVNEWSYFEFGGLRRGVYELRVIGSGVVPSQPQPVRVKAGETVELGKPVVFQDAVHLAVTIDPPLAGDDGVPWSVDLLRISGLSEATQVTEEAASFAGEWVSPPLAPGDYLLRVLDPDGTEVKEQQVTLADDDLDLALALDLVDFSGTVLLGDDPLEAVLTFGGTNGPSCESDEDG